MTHLRFTFVTILSWGLVGGCVDGTIDGDGSGGDGLPPVGDVDDVGPDLDDPELDVLPTYPTAHPRIYLGPNQARLQADLGVGTPAATKFREVVDRWTNGGSVWGFQTWNAALMGQLTGEAKYCAKAIETVDAGVRTDEARIAAGTKPVVAENSYLHIGAIIGDLALVYDWCFDAVPSAMKTRWLAYANQAVANVWDPATSSWGGKPAPWTGWAVNDPANNYYYSFLRATMLLGLATRGEHPQGQAWIDEFRDRRFYGQLVPNFEAELAGGGSREGTGYGVAHRNLFELYDLWKATTGEKLAAKTKHARQSLRLMMHQIVPTLDKVAPIGDQARDPSAGLFDYHRDYLQQLIAMYPTDPAAARAKTLLAQSSVATMTRPELMAKDFLSDNAVAPAPLDGMATAYHAPGIGQVFARSGWDKQATWLGMIAGPYTQSHAHQDQGSLLLYKGGWLVYDAAVSSRSGIGQATTAHGLVRIDRGGQPIPQRVNTTSRLESLHRGSGWLHVAADVTPAYKEQAGIDRVQRELVYLEPDVVIVYDRVTTGGDTRQVWQLPTPVRPEIAGTRATISNAGHTLTVHRLAPAGATSSVHGYAGSSEYVGGFRLDAAVAGGDVRYLHVLSLDGGAAQVTASGDSSVTVQLAGGGSATVAFNRDAIGAELTYQGKTTTLGAGVDSLPE
jgi:hypothetical protein